MKCDNCRWFNKNGFAPGFGDCALRRVVHSSNHMACKYFREMTREEIALNIACDLLIGSVLYGYDYDRIFEEIMERDGVVSSDSIKEFILDNIQELGKEYFVREGEEK